MQISFHFQEMNILYKNIKIKFIAKWEAKWLLSVIKDWYSGVIHDDTHVFVYFSVLDMLFSFLKDLCSLAENVPDKEEEKMNNVFDFFLNAPKITLLNSKRRQ